MVAAARRGQAQRAVARRLGLAWDTCNTGWPAHEANDWIGWTGRSIQRSTALTDGKPRPVCNTESWLCGVNCDKAIWDSLAHRPSRMRCGPNVLTDGCRVCAPSGGSSSDTGLWMPCGVCVAVHRPQAGICRRWRRGTAELDAFDVIEDLPLEGGPRLDVLTTRALWGSVCGAWISAAMRARWLCERLETHWRAHGCPAYAQFDNDSRFQGTHTHPDVLGQVIRFCLLLGVTPCSPRRENTGRKTSTKASSSVATKVWHRFHHASALAFQARSDRFVAATSDDGRRGEDHAPGRRPFPKRWTLDLHQRPRGMVIYLRRTDEFGAIRVLGHRLEVDAQWVHRLVRAEVDLEAQQIRCYRLRRRASGRTAARQND